MQGMVLSKNPSQRGDLLVRVNVSVVNMAQLLLNIVLIHALPIDCLSHVLNSRAEAKVKGGSPIKLLI